MVPAHWQIKTSDPCLVSDRESLGGRPCLTLSDTFKGLWLNLCQGGQNTNRHRFAVASRLDMSSTQPRGETLWMARELKYSWQSENTTEMKGTSVVQGCFTFAKGIQLFNVLRFGEHRDPCMSSTGTSMEKGIYVISKIKTRPEWEHWFQQCSRFRSCHFRFQNWVSNDCPGRVDVSVLEWCLSPYKLI